MRPKLQKRSAQPKGHKLKFVGRIIPRTKSSGEQSREAEGMIQLRNLFPKLALWFIPVNSWILL